MQKKPTYEKLEKRVKELEKERRMAANRSFSWVRTILTSTPMKITSRSSVVLWKR